LRHCRNSFGVPIEHPPARHQARPKLLLEHTQPPEQSIDGATRRLLLARIHTDGEESVVAPFPRAAQRRPVRFPLIQEHIHLGQQPV